MPRTAARAQSHLTVISPPAVETPVETVAQRVRRLQAEARALAREQVAELEVKLEEAAAIAAEIAEGGEAYPVGARELARRIAEDTPKTIQTFEAILYRA
jgi:hypothetical protein